METALTLTYAGLDTSACEKFSAYRFYKWLDFLCRRSLSWEEQLSASLNELKLASSSLNCSNQNQGQINTPTVGCLVRQQAENNNGT